MARIVLVEDDDDVRGLLAATLPRAGHQVRPARTGGQGLELHAAAPADVLVMDLCTPGLSGVESIARLRDGGDATPVVAISGAGFLLDAEPPLRRAMTTALDVGADAFLPKPFATRVLVAAIRRVLGEDLMATCGPDEGRLRHADVRADGPSRQA